LDVGFPDLELALYCNAFQRLLVASFFQGIFFSTTEMRLSCLRIINERRLHCCANKWKQIVRSDAGILRQPYDNMAENFTDRSDSGRVGSLEASVFPRGATTFH
jgi:hypothetical protein